MKEYAWLEEILAATVDSEAPLRFKFWAALYSVACATKRQVYLNQGGLLKTYPNLFVMLVADSGLGKQFPIDMASSLLRAANVTRVSNGRYSIEKITGNLGRMLTLDNGTIIKNAEVALISGEFANMLISNPDALTILTQWYDTDANSGVWENDLKIGTDRLRGMYVNLLAATNMEHFNEKISERDLKGGFISRTICIHETKPAKLNSLIRPAPPVDWSAFSERLVQISKLRGEFSLTDAAALAYDDWYKEFYAAIRYDKTGFLRRVRTHILKVAMCLSLVESDNLTVSEKHILDALELIVPLIESNEEITAQSGKSRYSSQIALIIRELISAPDHSMSRKRLLSRHIRDFSNREMSEILDTLIQGGYVERVMDDSEVIYTLSARARSELK